MFQPPQYPAAQQGFKAVSVHNASFSWHPKADPVLQDVNLDISPGEKHLYNPWDLGAELQMFLTLHCSQTSQT